MAHICIGNLAIIWPNAGILFIGHLRTNFSEILIKIHTFSFKEMFLKMSSAKWRPFCLGLNVFNLLLVRLNVQAYNKETWEFNITLPLCRKSAWLVHSPLRGLIIEKGFLWEYIFMIVWLVVAHKTKEVVWNSPQWWVIFPADSSEWQYYWRHLNSSIYHCEAYGLWLKKRWHATELL